MNLQITGLDDPNILLELNNAAVPDINELNLAKAQWLVDHVVMPGLAVLDGRAAGFIAVLNERSRYNSDYFRWFTDRYENFLYIDRVVVAKWARGQGIARALYQKVEQVAEKTGLAIVADVYSDPPNMPSLNLHRAMAFQEIGAQHFPAERKIAAKFMKYPERAKPKG